MTDPSGERWTQMRYDYEHTDRPVADICAEHGISDGTLRDRVRRWGWSKRRAPIPREGPPAVAALPDFSIAPKPVEDGRERPLVAAGEQAVPAAPVAPVTAAPADTDQAAVAPRLQSAVARVLPAIEAIIARLSAQPLRPRELEQTARALGALTRTLRELNGLLAQQPLRAPDNDRTPVDIDTFRNEFARRIEALCAAHKAEAAARRDETVDD
jgi:transposase-like protein